MKKIYTINGANFCNLKGFYDEISNVLVPGTFWGRNLDAFNDILDGGYGTPDVGFVIVWKNSKKSQQDLGYKETLHWLRDGLEKIHPTNTDTHKKRIEIAEKEVGETLFGILIDIIVGHEQIELHLV